MLGKLTPTPPKWAVVQVNPTTDGTDETKGQTVVGRLSHEEAVALKMGMLKGLRHAGWIIEDGWRAYPPRGVQGEDIGLLITSQSLTPKMKGAYK